jgi:uncharacterized repeat protein (TIGR02543 family)
MKLTISSFLVLMATFLTPVSSFLVFQETGHSHVSFDTNGGQFLSPIKERIGLEIDLPNPNRIGHTFVDWYSDVNLTKRVISFTTQKYPVTLFAKWAINQYSISFQSNEGSQVLSITRDYDSMITGPSNPTREGHTFIGWYTDHPTYNQPFTFPARMPADNLTLYAKWNARTFAISFDSNQGSSVNPIIQNYGTVVTQPSIPTRSNFYFAGWFKDNITFTLPFEFPTTMPSENLTLYAKWNSGTGTLQTPFFISNLNDVELVRQNPRANFRLSNHVILPDTFVTIPSFSGSIDGNNYQLTIDSKPFIEDITDTGSIFNLRITITYKADQNISIINENYGLFASTNKGSFKDITITFTTRTVQFSPIGSFNNYYVGFLGKNEGVMENIILETGTLTISRVLKNITFGPLVGWNSSRLKNIENRGTSIQSDSIELGGIVGYSTGVLENLTNRANHKNVIKKYSSEWSFYTGGLVGILSGPAEQLANYGNVEVNSTDDYVYVGGVAGMITSEVPLKIKSVFNYGQVKGTTNLVKENYYSSYIGGIASEINQQITIERSGNHGMITNHSNVINESVAMGGLTGTNLGGTILESYNLGFIQSFNKNISTIGGLSGITRSGGSILKSLNKGNISSMNQASSSFVGGISGDSVGGLIVDNYNHGSISLTNQSSTAVAISFSGGIVGDIWGDSNSTVRNNYSSGSTFGVTSSNLFGGIIGRINQRSHMISNNHYLDTALINHGIARNDNNIGVNTGTTQYSSISGMYNLASTLGNNWQNITGSTPKLKWE